MASAPQVQQTEQNKKQIRLGQEDTQRARARSAPLQQDFQKKMNRDDSGRLGGMASADVMQAAGQNRSGQLLAGGQGGGYEASNLGGQLEQATSNASSAALARQDSMKSSYNELGNKNNINAAASLGSLASNASQVATAEANATATRQNAMIDSATSVAAAKGLSMKDAYDTANYDLKRGIKKAGYSGPFESNAIKSLREKRNNVPGKNFFDKYWSN
jgi:hypothetical protein